MSDYASLDALRAQMRKLMGTAAPAQGDRPRTLAEGLQGRQDIDDPFADAARPDPTYDKTKK